MNKSLNITQSAAIEAYKNADTKGQAMLVDLFGNEVFSQKITDRIKTLEDACFETGTDINSLRTADEKLEIIVKALNEGVKLDYSNTTQYKYYPIWEWKNGGFVLDSVNHWRTNASVSPRLCFVSAELCRYATQQFAGLYKEWLGC